MGHFSQAVRLRLISLKNIVPWVPALWAPEWGSRPSDSRDASGNGKDFCGATTNCSSPLSFSKFVRGSPGHGWDRDPQLCADSTVCQRLYPPPSTPRSHVTTNWHFPHISVPDEPRSFCVGWTVKHQVILAWVAGGVTPTAKRGRIFQMADPPRQQGASS